MGRGGLLAALVAAVHRQQVIGGQGGRYLVQGVLDGLGGCLGADQRDDVLRHDHVLRVGQRDEPVVLDRRRGRVDVGQVDLALLERLDGQRAAAVGDRDEAEPVRGHPVGRGEPLRTVRALGQLGVAADPECAGGGRQVGQRGDVVLLGELLGDVVGVLVLGGCRGEDREAGRRRGSQRLGDLVRRRRGGLRVEVLQQVSGVLGHEVDRAVLEGTDVDVPGADLHVALDLDALGLEGLGVELGDDLGLGEVGRADPDGAGSGGRGGGAAGRRVGGGAAGEGQQQRCGQGQEAYGSAVHGFPSGGQVSPCRSRHGRRQW
ncbi:hypothetical protein SDC9_116571 [bioreactor metagenome]|uniref:Uncharacterized protein n=1 Tax=bioreactor metagenome TaxID=1076179 RepID=A0A645C2Q3_9ZZZZ